MTELPPRRSALADAYRVGEFGAVPLTGPGITISERYRLAVVQLVAALPDYESVASRIESALGLAPPATANRALTKGELAILWTGPGRVLVVGPDTRPLETELAAAIGETAAAITDLGHSRTVLRLAGPRLRDLLAKGCGIDFHPRAFGAGACAQSSYARINVLLHAVDDGPTIDLYVYRGFARALWEHLFEGALEFGCRVTR